MTTRAAQQFKGFWALFFPICLWLFWSIIILIDISSHNPILNFVNNIIENWSYLWKSLCQQNIQHFDKKCETSVCKKFMKILWNQLCFHKYFLSFFIEFTNMICCYHLVLLASKSKFQIYPKIGPGILVTQFKKKREKDVFCISVLILV